MMLVSELLKYYNQTMRQTLLFKISVPVILVALLIPVYLDLGKENVNVDQSLWYGRTASFSKALVAGDFSQTYQQYHPGVTFMYLIVSGQKLYEIISKTSSDYTTIPYNKFPLYNFCTKFFVTTTCVILNFFSAAVLIKITKRKVIGLGFLLLLFTEPIYIGLLRNLHMDVLVASFIFAGVVSFYAGLTTGRIRYLIISGLLCGLGLLTKSIAITALALNFAVGLYFYYLNKEVKYIKYFGLSCVVATVIFFALFPAMWVSPVQTLNNIYSDGILKTGILGEDNFGHTVRGITTHNPGYGYYLNIFKFRLSPLAQFSLAAIVVVICFFYFKKIKDEKMTLVVFSALYILGYFIAFSILQKKTDRYIAPMLPFISLAAVLTVQMIYDHIRSKKLRTVFILFLSIGIAVNLLTVIKIHPYYMAYYNPVWGGINKAKKKIYINQGGIGAYEIASFLNSKDLTEADKIGATNLELQAFSKYFIHALDPDVRKTYRYVVLTLQKDDDFKHGMTLVYTVKVLGETYFRVYERK